MKRLIILLMVFGAAFIFLSCSENNSTAPELIQGDQVENSLTKKPAPFLEGITKVPFNMANYPFVWDGTVDFGEGQVYGLKFKSYGAPRDFSQAFPFYEDFFVYDLTDPDVIYMKGWNQGVVAYANRPPLPCKFLANGKIEEASGPFAMWQGRGTHIRGLVYWTTDGSGLPEIALGVLKIN